MRNCEQEKRKRKKKKEKERKTKKRDQKEKHKKTKNTKRTEKEQKKNRIVYTPWQCNDIITVHTYRAHTECITATLLPGHCTYTVTQKLKCVENYHPNSVY